MLNKENTLLSRSSDTGEKGEWQWFTFSLLIPSPLSVLSVPQAGLQSRLLTRRRSATEALEMNKNVTAKNRTNLRTGQNGAGRVSGVGRGSLNIKIKWDYSNEPHFKIKRVILFKKKKKKTACEWSVNLGCKNEHWVHISVGCVRLERHAKCS